MFTTSGREKYFSDRGAPKRPYCQALPAISEAPEDWRAFRQYVRQRGIDPQIAQLNAWYPSRAAGDTALRVVIPGTSRDPANQFWQARLIEDCTAGLVKRYQSPHAARGDALIVVHPELTCGEAEEPSALGTVLVEGPFDALAAAELGFVGIALMGNTPSEEILDHAVAWLKAGPPAVLVADEDAVERGADLGWRLLVQHGLKSLLMLSPYPYKDLAEMPLAERRRMFREGGAL